MTTNARPGPWADDALRALQRPDLLGTLPSTDALLKLLARHAPQYPHTPSDQQPPAPDAPAEDVHRAVLANHWRHVAHQAAHAIVTEVSPSLQASDLTHVLQWWHLRLVALWKLRLFAQAHTELTDVWSVLDRILVQPGSRPLRTTALVPFALHLLRAQDMLMHGQKRAGITALWQHLAHCEDQERTTDDAVVWRARARRIRLLLASALVEMEALDAAAAVVDPLAETLLHGGMDEADALASLALVRIYVAMGCLARAEALAEAARATQPSLGDAYTTLVRLVRDPLTDPPALFPTEPLDQVKANTAAVDAFYRGDLDTGVQLLEALLHEQPSWFATAPGLAGNLFTLHTMGYGGGVAARRHIVECVADAAGDDPACIDSRMG
ncbi:hypothetical protein MBRA1_001280 [Malassezia brasiliensis]|uniref:Uncharacterized protein n=1 Tax=Malassezia brasiliensis TaxID=1821822 RepID=A0AAF0DTS6_9BASI|nr:hypothetical protein MBRA1_001280 [Malassezia brasiliensis]